MSKIDQNYDEINKIIKQISTRTLEMKSNNVKLLNKIGTEMSILLEKVQEIVRFCISDRNDFVKEIELIQFDFLQLEKKIDQKFSIQSQLKPTENQTIKNKSVINTILDSDDSENEAPKQLPFSSVHHLMVPDTCMPQFEAEHIKMPSKQLIIRDTIDSNFDEIFNDRERNKLETINENYIINESLDKKKSLDKNLDETCLEEEAVLDMIHVINKKSHDLSKNHLLKTSQSTPLAVKKKLQEHGLLDLTNSPYQTPTKNAKISTPVKYLQSRISFESPRDSKTPVKVVLKTPTKSPSLLIKKPNFHNSNDDEKFSNVNQNDSFDFSFEFRQQAKTKSSTSSKSSLPKNSQTNATVLSTSSAKSPKVKNSQNSRNKRFKQLSDSNDNKIFSFFARKSFEQNSKNSAGSADLDDTCLINEDFLKNVKSEPISNSQVLSSNQTSDSFVSIFANKEPKQSNKVGFKSFILRKMGFIKGQYKQNEQKESRSSSDDDEKNEQINNQRRYLSKDYFSDFDKVPKKKENSTGNYKYLEVVRKQDERKKLPTWACNECETYWNSVPEELRHKRMENVCRHRAKHQAPPTPEHFWSVEFPNTQECVERGYGGIVAQNDRDDITKRSRRKRPLKLIENPDKNSENDIKELDFGD